MRIAMGAAVETVRAGTAQLERGAAAVQRATSEFALPAAAAAPAAPGTAPATPTTGVPQGQPLAQTDLLAGMTELVLARATVGAGTTTARAADEAYRAVLDLGRR